MYGNSNIEQARIGERVEVECKTCANPDRRTYNWTKNGKSLRAGISGQGTNIITIHSVREGDRDRVKIEGGGGLGEREDIERSLLRDVTWEEVRGSVRGLKNGKAMGIDNVPNEFLKKGGPTLWSLLAKAFNMAIREERILNIWREGQVLLLHKGDGTGWTTTGRPHATHFLVIIF